MKYRIFLVFIILAFLLPIYAVNAESNDYSSDEAKIKFTVDESFWGETALSQERDYINKKWTNSVCGTLMYGISDLYESMPAEEKKGILAYSLPSFSRKAESHSGRNQNSTVPCSKVLCTR